MVIAHLLLIGMAWCCASSAFAVTADELRGYSADKDREVMQRQNRVNTESLGDLLPPESAPKSNKYGKPLGGSTSNKSRSTKTDATGNKPAANKPDTSNIYTPLSRSGDVSVSQNIVTDAVQPTVAFGIRTGTWLNASLDRNTTSAESGTVELTLTADAFGDRRTLPAGTMLFAEKSLNSATKRLELVVTHGITPAGREFELRGIVFDPQKIPGLAGLYVIDKKEVATKGFSKGVIAAAGAAASTLGNGITGAATSAASQSILNDANQVTESNATQAIIYVTPQALIIRVEKQF